MLGKVKVKENWRQATKVMEIIFVNKFKAWFCDFCEHLQMVTWDSFIDFMEDDQFR